MMMLSASKKDIEEDLPIYLECEPDIDKMAQRVQNMFNFKQFYDYMEFGWPKSFEKFIQENVANIKGARGCSS